MKAEIVDLWAIYCEFISILMFMLLIGHINRKFEKISNKNDYAF